MSIGIVLWTALLISIVTLVLYFLFTYPGDRRP